MTRVTDYLVVGAGATGLAFADSLLSESDADILLVDRRTAVGGHWCDSYPFVQLHTPSAYYGVNSLPLGEDRIVESGRNRGFYEQATGAEVRAYFDAVLRQRLEPSGRVTFLAEHEYVDHHDGIARIRDLGAGTVSEVVVRRRVVDARYQEASIPATHTPSFSIDPDARFVPVGSVPERAGDYRRFVVVGAGKTGADTCLWLLDVGVDPNHVRWIRPRDMWFNDRAGLQPLDQVGPLIGGLADDAEAGAHARDLFDLCHRLEEVGRLMRLDASTEPTMYRGTMLSRPELEELQKIDNVVRLGRVRAVDPTRVLLDDGDITTGVDELIIDCSARGLAPSPPVPVFDDDTIRLQQLRHNSPTFNAALIAFIEAHRDDDFERNRLAPPNPYPSTPRDMASMLTRTWITARIWQGEPDVQSWIDQSRLNLTRGLAQRMADPPVRAAVERFVTHVAEATRRMPTLV